jgi:hypothetical protein
LQCTFPLVTIGTSIDLTNSSIYAHMHALFRTVSARHQMHFLLRATATRCKSAAVRMRSAQRVRDGGVWPTEVSLSSYSRSDGGPFVRGPRRNPYAGPLPTCTPGRRRSRRRSHRREPSPSGAHCGLGGLHAFADIRPLIHEALSRVALHRVRAGRVCARVDRVCLVAPVGPHQRPRVPSRTTWKASRTATASGSPS